LISTFPEPARDPGPPAASVPCRVHDPDLWFAELESAVERAKALCGTCSQRVVCRAGALDRREPWGVWGGSLFQQGTIIARKRGPGRPPKNRAGEVAA
jgi:WhiB family transcriptional regulator, redox-sensing transcriptional regulator